MILPMGEVCDRSQFVAAEPSMVSKRNIVRGHRPRLQGEFKPRHYQELANNCHLYEPETVATDGNATARKVVAVSVSVKVRLQIDRPCSSLA